MLWIDANVFFSFLVVYNLAHSTDIFYSLMVELVTQVSFIYGNVNLFDL